MCQKVTPLPSVLYTTEAETLKKQVADDLTTPDPEPEEAEASLREARMGEPTKRSIWNMVKYLKPKDKK